MAITALLPSELSSEITDLGANDYLVGQKSGESRLSRLPASLLPGGTTPTFGDGSANAPSIAHTGDSNTGFYFPAAGHIAAATAGAARWGIDSSGRVVVGGAFPATWYGNLVVYGASYQSFAVQSSTGVNVMLAANANSDARLGTPSNHPLDLYTNNSLRARLTADGNLIIADTASDGYGKLQVNGNASLRGYTRLGGAAAPAIKQKKITGTTAAAQGGTVDVAHGITESKIIAVTALVYDGSNHFPPRFVFYAEREYDVYTGNGSVVIALSAANSSYILSKAFKVLITYEE